MSEINSLDFPNSGPQSDLHYLADFFDATRNFAEEFNSNSHEELRNVTDGKTMSTYVEALFKDYLVRRKVIPTEDKGNFAKGIDLPSLNVDIKLTAFHEPQTSSPYKTPKQKIEGLGHHLILFAYEKREIDGRFFLPFIAVRFIPKERTGDNKITQEILDTIARDGNAADIAAYLQDKLLITDSDELESYSQWVYANPPKLGYLSSYYVPQWRLTYRKVVKGTPEGIVILDPQGT